MSKNNRELKVLAAVACPTCHAPRGRPCRQHTPGHRLTVCTERRRAWQTWNADRPADYTHQNLGRQAFASLLCPQSVEARDRLARVGTLVDGALRLEDEPSARDLIRRLTIEGWKVGSV